MYIINIYWYAYVVCFWNIYMHMPYIYIYIYIYTISYVHAIFLHHKFKVNLQVFHFHRGRQQAERLADSWPNGWKNGCRLVLKVWPEIVRCWKLIDSFLKILVIMRLSLDINSCCSYQVPHALHDHIIFPPWGVGAWNCGGMSSPTRSYVSCRVAGDFNFSPRSNTPDGYTCPQSKCTFLFSQEKQDENEQRWRQQEWLLYIQWH